ncbi:general transcription factor IIIAa isoform X2 [Clupea harengus]|uniref:Transcription factor IIIA n=1 Tax=Clupea harengus TaxID=7950 RepID=A0A6P8ERB6_CLUHA|nr:general transcription factor IIIAa isoform X2 [Clupea harengus]
MVLRHTKAKNVRCLKLRGPTSRHRISFSEIAGMEVKTKDDGFLPSLLEGKFYNSHPQRCTESDCTEAFTTKYNLKRHMSRKHKPNQLYKCSFDGCGQEFHKNSQLKSHKSEHSQSLPYLCGFEGCGRRLATSSKLRRHEKVHQGYPCSEEGCSFVGKTWTESTKHRKDVHRVLLKCDQCDKTFRDCWFLRQHQRVHLEERLVFKCPREDCERSYTKLFNLQSHIQSFHEEQRPFACTHADCGKTFAMKQSLRRHLVTHDPLRRKQEKKPRKITKTRRERKPKKVVPGRSLPSHLSGFNPESSHKLDNLDTCSPIIESVQSSFPDSSHTGQCIEIKTA